MSTAGRNRANTTLPPAPAAHTALRNRSNLKACAHDRPRSSGCSGNIVSASIESGARPERSARPAATKERGAGRVAEAAQSSGP